MKLLTKISVIHLLFLISITECIWITQVDQPSSGYEGCTYLFRVKINGNIQSEIERPTGRLLITIEIPDDWEIKSAWLESNNHGIVMVEEANLNRTNGNDDIVMTEIKDLEEYVDDEYVQNRKKWRGISECIENIIREETGVLHFLIKVGEPGDFYINYWIGSTWECKGDRFEWEMFDSDLNHIFNVEPRDGMACPQVIATQMLD